MAEDGYKVILHVYDLSQGMARQLSSTFLGRVIEGIWHTGVVVYGNEYFFGAGIQHAPVGTTQYGTPLRVVDLGVTHVPKELFEEYLQEISSRYTAETYSLLKHNCNNFSNEVTQFLVGANIPDYILQLPNDVMSSPMGPLIMPMIQQLETTLRAGAVPQTPQFRPQFRPSPMTMAQPSQPKPMTSSTTMTTSEDLAKKLGSDNTSKSPPSTKSSEERTVNGVAGDPLGDARAKVQEEISSEFAALMATGTMGASEAATIATRRVMERHGRMNVVMPHS